MEEMYIVTKDGQICFLATNEEDILKYIEFTPEMGINFQEFEKEYGLPVREWLDNGHVVEELMYYTNNDYDIKLYFTGYEYREDSPWEGRKIV